MRPATRTRSALAGSAALLAAACTAPGPTFNGTDVVPRDARDAALFETGADWADCQPGQTRCRGTFLDLCVAGREFTTVQSTDCAERNLVCSSLGCQPCAPGQRRCTSDRAGVEQCTPDGQRWVPAEDCDVGNGYACRTDHCLQLCADPYIQGSNIGCEYFAVDLDNAALGPAETAASQQYAVVVSNPNPEVTARVRIELNTAPPGAPLALQTVATAVIPPLDLQAFPLPAREVDCSAPGTFNTGTGTCLSSQAYRITSTAPVIAYQFNPFENGLQFSNDASLLIPTNSLSGDYRVMSWPQTLASRPWEIVLNPSSPTDLRGFLTVVGVRPNTRVRVSPAADVVPGGPLGRRVSAGEVLEFNLGPFDTLNLETDGFLADFTGSVVQADGPVAVFSGSECSDVPAWTNLNDRRCCCDHLESQSFPRDTTGVHYIAVHTPNRTPIVRAAGAAIGVLESESEWFRILAVTPGVTHVETTLFDDAPPDGGVAPRLRFDLREGEFRTLAAAGHFEVQASAPVAVANFMASQLNTGINLNYPGGDPSFIPMPAVEQWRARYVFLTPDKYAFDFVQVMAPPDVTVRLDGSPLPTNDCAVGRVDGCVESPRNHCPAPNYVVYSCQLSFPVVSNDVPYPNNVSPGLQRDGVHIVDADAPVGVVVSGFDLRVSYGYPAGTQLLPLF